MKLSDLMKWIGFLTVIALVYTHMQMNIIHLAYEGRNKEKVIRQLMEQNGYLTYNILSIKSANNLGHKLLAEESDMDFVSPKDVMVLATPDEYFTQEVYRESQKPKEKPSFLLSLLSFGAQAEAKPHQ